MSQIFLFKKMTEKELREKLAELRVIIDTREQRNEHISAYLTRKKVASEQRKLDVGDYSAELSDGSFERSFVIERKRNLDEICGNFTSDRERFERELLRAKAYGIKVFLLIEDASWNDVFLHNYRSKLSEKALMASLLSWQVRYNVTVIFCKKENSPQVIHGLLYYAAREELLGL